MDRESASGLHLHDPRANHGNTAVLVSTTQNIVRSASWLLLSLSGAAGLFFYLGADFVVPPSS